MMLEIIAPTVWPKPVRFFVTNYNILGWSFNSKCRIGDLISDYEGRPAWSEVWQSKDYQYWLIAAYNNRLVAFEPVDISCDGYSEAEVRHFSIMKAPQLYRKLLEEGKIKFSESSSKLYLKLSGEGKFKCSES